MNLCKRNVRDSYIAEIFFNILFNIGIFLSLSPSFIATFYESWQATIVGRVYSPPRNPNVAYLNVLLAMFLFIITAKKNLYFKLISVYIITRLVIWVTDTSIPMLRLEYTLLSPLKEQCYALLEIVPSLAIVYFLIFWGLKSLFYNDFDPQETMAKRIVIIVTICGGLLLPYFIPYIIF